MRVALASRRAGVAKLLRQQIQDALRADEHATALDSVVGRWLDDSMKLLLDIPRESVPQPVVPDPRAPYVALPTPSVPVSPGSIVTSGQRKITGRKAWHVLAGEIERELTEDAELEMNWRIVKRRPE